MKKQGAVFLLIKTAPKESKMFHSHFAHFGSIGPAILIIVLIVVVIMAISDRK